MSAELTHVTDAQVARTEQSSASTSQAIMRIIAENAANPSCDTGKMQALLDMQIKVMALEAKALYDAAMSRLQPRLPVIRKDSKGANGKYASIESIDAAIGPLLKEEGFHFVFTSGPAPPPSKDMIVTGRLIHKGGHVEEASIPVALDTSGSKTPTQGAVSTISYGIRALKRMFLDLNMVGEDRDGSPAPVITRDQADTIETLIANIVDNPAGYRLRCRARLLAAMAVGDVTQIPIARFREAVNKLELAAQGPKS
jgi:hypothetical protein